MIFRLQFNPEFLCIGLRWRHLYGETELWFCPLPMLVFYFRWNRKDPGLPW